MFKCNLDYCVIYGFSYTFDWSLVMFVACGAGHDSVAVWVLSAFLSDFCKVADCSAGNTAFSPQLSPDTNTFSDHNVPQDMLTGKIWLSIRQLNWKCTCHSLLDKLWLEPIQQPSELWKPLMDEIWTSIFLSSCLLNKLLFKFTTMFADMCCGQRSCLPAFLSALVIFWGEENSLSEKLSKNRNMWILS